jgi:hypothetical protein
MTMKTMALGAALALSLLGLMGAASAAPICSWSYIMDHEALLQDELQAQSYWADELDKDLTLYDQLKADGQTDEELEWLAFVEVFDLTMWDNFTAAAERDQMLLDRCDGMGN